MLLRELERTGAFERKVLVIVPTTGTGWINPVAARALELMYNGDTAMVGIAVLVSAELDLVSRRPAEVDGVRPDDDRRDPRRGGRSCRPTGGPSWCSTARASARWPGRARSTGCPTSREMDFSSVLWVGPPNASPLWKGITVRRDPGTPGGRAALRQRPHRPVLAGHRRRRDRGRHATRRGKAPACCSCSTPRTRSCGGRRT